MAQRHHRLDAGGAARASSMLATTVFAVRSPFYVGEHVGGLRRKWPNSETKQLLEVKGKA